MTSRTKRFYYVATVGGKILHTSRHLAEGSRTDCGRPLRKGLWLWIKKATRRREYRVCKRCEAAEG